MMNLFFWSTFWVVGIAVSKVNAVLPSEQFQHYGPNRNDVNTQMNLARRWPKDGPPVIWTVKTGPGFSSASIEDDRRSTGFNI